METAAVHDLLATLFTYPGSDFADRAARCRAALGEEHPAAAAHLEELAAWAGVHTVEQAQELFVQTFDLNPVCSLEVGWHLYGDNYDRGEFLVEMRRRLREHGLAESLELPDHLTHAVAVLGRMAPEPAAGFWQGSVRPALRKMLDSLQGAGNPLEGALQATFLALEARHAIATPEVTHA